MRSRSKSSSSLSTSPTKQASITRSESSTSGGSDAASGCLPSMTMTTKEVHASTNAFYAQMLDAQKRKKREQRHMQHRELDSKPEPTRESLESETGRRANSEEPITALPALTRMPNTEDVALKTPRKKEGGMRLVPEGAGRATPTQRAVIEARKEQKMLDMLARAPPTTPTRVTFQDRPLTMEYDAKASIAAPRSGSTSPKKKFLGMNISVPSFLSASTDAMEHSSGLRMAPPPLPSLKALNPSPAPGGHKGGESNTRFRQEDAVSHLPNKVRELKGWYDSDIAGEDSPTLGRHVAGIATGAGPRSVSENISAWPDKSTQKKGQMVADSLYRSKSVTHTRDADVETIPPTPPAKNTPPRLVLDHIALADRRPAEAGSEATIVERATPVRRVHQLRNDYLELLEKAPSMYSLHGEIQQPPGNQNASLDYGVQTELDVGNKNGQINAREGRWREERLPVSRSHQQQESSKEPQRDAVVPFILSPSVYSVAGSMHDPADDVQHDRPLHLHPSSSQNRQNMRQSTVAADSIKSGEQIQLRPDIYQQEPSSEKPGKQDGDENNASNMQSVGAIRSLNWLSASPLGEQATSSVSTETKWCANMKGDPVRDVDGNGTSSRPEISENSSSDTNFTPSVERRDSMPMGHIYLPDFPHHSSAMPTPLFNGHGPGPTLPISPPPGLHAYHRIPPPGFTSPSTVQAARGPELFMLPDGSNLLTHFDVLNRHIMTVATSLHHNQTILREEVLKDSSVKHTEQIAAIESHAASQEQGVIKLNESFETNIKNVESCITKASTHSRQVFDDIHSKLDSITDQNTKLTARFDALQKQVDDVKKRTDSLVSVIKAEVARSVSSQLQSYMQTSHASPMHSHRMIFYDAAGHMYTAPTMQAAHLQNTSQPPFASPMQTDNQERTRRTEDFTGPHRDGQSPYSGANGYDRRTYQDSSHETSRQRYHDGGRTGSNTGYQGH